MTYPAISTEDASYRRYASVADTVMAYVLPLRHISAEAMEVYRRYFRIPGPTRQPMLTWTRELPIEGQPEDVVCIVDACAKWLSTSAIPKLFIDAEPAGFLIGAQR